MHRIWLRVKGASSRRIAKWFGRRNFVVPASRRIISFTFDDFPRSSLLKGGDILAQAGFAATYYTALGLSGKRIATGEMFLPEDLPRLVAAGHELGCHTYDHCPAWETPPNAYCSSVDKNLREFAASKLGVPIETHSYPISYPRPPTKVRLARQFCACRGGGQIANLGTTDLNYLNSIFLEQCVDNFAVIENAIDSITRDGGWLIFSTHDVTEQHTRFGCSPAFFSRVVRHAVLSGATILPVAGALSLLGATKPA